MTEQVPSDELLKRLCGDSSCKDKGTYLVKAVCTNCDWSGNIELTRGHEFLSYCTSCPGCGCARLMRRSK